MAPANCAISRSVQLERLRAEHFDLAVIGGGINGAAIARDAAMRGLRVALVDRGDFAGATSSRSSKLIHGGLRYLPQGQLRLVREALRERQRLLALTAPHLVHPIRFLFPCYRGLGPGRFSLWVGLALYDLLARTTTAYRYRRLSADGVREREPALARKLPDGHRLDGHRLDGGALYYDAWGDDARVTLENALDAGAHGAAIANHVAIEGFSRIGARIASAAARDLLGGGAIELRARHFVNATGPWLDDLRRLDQPRAAPSVRLTKGVHLVVDAARLPVRDSIVLGDAAGRIVFVMPHEGWVILGTTDTDFDGDREHVHADDADVAYLLELVNAAMPAAHLTPGDVAYSFAGLRALERDAGGGAPSAIPREEIVIESASGLISVAGGKLTTHRAIAQKIVDSVMWRMGRPAGRCPTLTTPLPGARDGLEFSLDVSALPADVASMLADRYGTRAALVAAIVRERPELAARIVPGAPAIRAEVVHAIRNELAASLSDFLGRRTSMVWRDPASAIASAAEVARLMGAELNWNGARVEDEIHQFFRAHALRITDANRDATAHDEDSNEHADGRTNIR
jgi:glycerol-3-phosphate dehydrogenase